MLMGYNKKTAYVPALDWSELRRFRGQAVVLDVETIGNGQLIEICEITVASLDQQILYSNYLLPVYNNTKKLLQEDGKKNFRRHLTWAEVHQDLKEVLDNKIIIAYNASFDARAVAAENSRLQGSPQFTERAWRCALLGLKQRMNWKRSFKLQEVYRAMEEKLIKQNPEEHYSAAAFVSSASLAAWHTAAFDVLALSKIINYVLASELSGSLNI